MFRIAIVDDDEETRALERGFIEKYSEETGEQFEIVCFNSGIDFITDYMPVYDIVFMDIEMPLMSGMDAAKKLRERDDKICIVFITKVAKYAIEGYSVNAVDYVIKPIKYNNFIDKLKKALRHAGNREEKQIVLKCDDNYILVPVSAIYYVMKDKNYLIYNTQKGKITIRGTMKNVEEELADCGFSVCNSGCIVNLRQVRQVTQNSVVVNGEQLPLSRRRYNDFKKAMFDYLRGGQN